MFAERGDHRRAVLQRRQGDERGMNTAEYAVGTVAACGFAGLLFMCHDWYEDLIRTLLQAALQDLRWWRPITW